MQSDDNTTIASSIAEEVEEEDALSSIDTGKKYFSNKVGLYNVSGRNLSDPNLTSIDQGNIKAMKKEILSKANHPHADTPTSYATEPYAGNKYSSVSTNYESQSNYLHSRNKKPTVSEDDVASKKHQQQEQHPHQSHPPPPPPPGYYHGYPPPHHGPPHFGHPQPGGSLSTNNLLILLISAITLAGIVHFGTNSMPNMQGIYPAYTEQHPAMVSHLSHNKKKQGLRANDGMMVDQDDEEEGEGEDVDENGNAINMNNPMKGNKKKKGKKGFYEMNDDMVLPNPQSLMNNGKMINNQQQNIVPVYDQNGNPMLDQNGNIMMIMQPNQMNNNFVQQGNNAMVMQSGSTMAAPNPNLETSDNAMMSVNGQQIPGEQQLAGAPQENIMEQMDVSNSPNAGTMGNNVDTNQIQTDVTIGTEETDRQTQFPLKEMNHFKDNWDPWERTDVPVFFHIPKAGGSTVKDVIGTCHRFVMATEMGITDGHANEKEIAVVYPGGGPVGQDRSPFVNVDTTTVDGILRAKQMGFADSGLADAVVTPFVYEANDLFTPTAKGRLFTVFRHPIERAISMFYYIQDAHWEPTYDPELKGWTIAQYAQSSKIENNWLTRQLTNKLEGDLDDSHLNLAMEVIRRKFMVGLMTKIEETMERFERFFHWTYHVNPPNQEKCREQLMTGGSNRNSSGKKKEKPKEGSEDWELLAWQNQYDLQLYLYIEALFSEQEQFVADIPVGFRLVDATCCKCGPPTFPPEGFKCPEAVLN